MMIRSTISAELVWVDGRGKIRLLDAMADAGIPMQEVGLPVRRYQRSGGVTIIAGKTGKPYERIDLDIRHVEPDGKEIVSAVVSREPIPYVHVYGELYEYEPGQLFEWSKRRKERKPVFPRGEVFFEVLGRSANGERLRVKLPHKEGEWEISERMCIWVDRQLTPLDFRLQELWLQDRTNYDYQQPMAGVSHLREFAFRERVYPTTDGHQVAYLAVEEWEQLRQHEDLSVDEALLAVYNSLLSDLDNKGTTYYSGPFATSTLERFRKGDWTLKDDPQVVRQMADLHTIEYEMLRGAMRAVAAARRYYARDAFDQLMK